MEPLIIQFFQYLEDIGEKKTPLEIKFRDPNKFKITPDDLHVKEDLLLENLNLTSLPDNLKVDGSLILSYCRNLTSLPNDLKVGKNLHLAGCDSLTSLPDNLIKVSGDLKLYSCPSITSLPDNLKVDGSLVLKFCENLTSLPDNLKVGGDLKLVIPSITSLPDNLEVDGNLYLLHTPLSSKTEDEIRKIAPGIKGEIF